MNYLFLLCIYVTAVIADIPTRNNTILFCLSPNTSQLNINFGQKNISVENPQINQVIKKYPIKNIEKWLPNARNNERDGQIYLNKIYKIIIDGNRQQLDALKNELELLPNIHSTEYEFIRQPTYTPNDSQYSQQWFLPQINADNAWDFWDISGNNTPGSKEVLLASVDTGVDWDHPDLRANIWNNLGEDLDGDGQTIIQSGGSWIFDPDDINFIDDDGNGYIDDFIGWDCSGFSGSQDNDPMPPDGVNNGGTWAHGTHVAGLLSANTDNNTGIASASFNCSIMSVKVSTGEQDYPYITHGYNGILYASQAGHDAGNYTIINNSWGGLGYSRYEQATINIAHEDYGAIVLAAGFGVLVCLRYIFSESQNDLKTRSGIGETPRPLNQEEIDADRLQLEQRAKERELEREIVRCQDEAKFLRRRISLCKSIESAKEELDTARSNWDSVQDEWGPKYSEIIERRNLFTRITLVVLILGFLISFTIYALISATEDVVPEDTLGAIFPYVFYASWLYPLLLFMVMNSNRVVDKEDPLLILRDSIPKLERQIEGENGTLNSLDSRGISIKRFGDALNLSTEDMVEMLEERESFIMNESKGD